MEQHFNRHGGLTIVAMPGFAPIAEAAAAIIKRKDSPPTEVDVVSPILGLRASGEPLVQLRKEHIGDHDCMLITSGPGTYEMLGQVLLVLGYLAGRRAGRITLVSGYLPLGRTDKDEGALEFALTPHIVHLLRAASYGKLDRIIACDLHAQQAVMAAQPGFITEVVLARRLLQRAVEDARRDFPDKHVCLLLPDDGASKRYASAVGEIGRKLGVELPVVCGIKRRWSSEEVEVVDMFGDVKALQDAVVVTLDDEIATGGTNIKTAEAVKAKHRVAAFWATAVHGVFCGKAPTLFSSPTCPVDRIYVTDTIPQANRPTIAPFQNRLRVVSWADDLASIIFYQHWGRSIRELR